MRILGLCRPLPLRSAGRAVPPAGDVVMPLTLRMRRGANTLVVGVRDDVSGTLSLVRVDEVLE